MPIAINSTPISLSGETLKTRIIDVNLNNGSLRTVSSVWYNNGGTLKLVYPDPIIYNGSGLGYMTNRGTYIANLRTSNYNPVTNPTPSTDASKILITTNNQRDSDTGYVDYGGGAYSMAIPINLTDFTTITVNATLTVTSGGSSRAQFMNVSLSTSKPDIKSNSMYGFPSWGSAVLSFNASLSSGVSPGYGNNGVAQTKSANIASYTGFYYIVVNSYLDTNAAGGGTSLVNSITLST